MIADHASVEVSSRNSLDFGHLRPDFGSRKVESGAHFAESENTAKILGPRFLHASLEFLSG